VTTGEERRGREGEGKLRGKTPGLRTQGLRCCSFMLIVVLLLFRTMGAPALLRVRNGMRPKSHSKPRCAVQRLGLGLTRDPYSQIHGRQIEDRWGGGGGPAG